MIHLLIYLLVALAVQDMSKVFSGFFACVHEVISLRCVWLVSCWLKKSYQVKLSEFQKH